MKNSNKHPNQLTIKKNTWKHAIEATTCTLKEPQKLQQGWNWRVTCTYLHLVAMDLYCFSGAFWDRCRLWHSENVHLWAWMNFLLNNKPSKYLLQGTATKKIKLQLIIYRKNSINFALINNWLFITNWLLKKAWLLNK